MTVLKLHNSHKFGFTRKENVNYKLCAGTENASYSKFEVHKLFSVAQGPKFLYFSTQEWSITTYNRTKVEICHFISISRLFIPVAIAISLKFFPNIYIA